MAHTLLELQPEENGIVTSLNNERDVRRKLMDLGITPGALVTMKKMAPLGDPLAIRVRGYDLTLRKSEAALITIESLSAGDIE